MTRWQYASLVLSYQGEVRTTQKRRVLPDREVVGPVWAQVWHGPEGERDEGFLRGDASVPVALLNAYGSRGWEAVAVLSRSDETVEYLFKRPAPVER
jgi:hypothetical protein